MITLQFLKELGFDSIIIPKPEGSLLEKIIGPAAMVLAPDDNVRNGLFIHENNKLLVAFNDTNSTITFGVCRNWTKYFEDPKKAEWLLSLNREKSNEKDIKATFIMIVKNHNT